jgi:hypothetical protein
LPSRSRASGVGEHAGEAVGADEEEVADLELVVDDVDVDLLVEAESADDDVLVREVDALVAGHLFMRRKSLRNEWSSVSAWIWPPRMR